ncbi:MAG: hypothetical protein J3Q66DRAFT_414467 [Benniella sp.]|nr:MAG: hypothetical protein J3Q66DRAFT_414467 [Benniella sp.]
MLDIPELDYMVCQQLNRHDLLQCIRVSKKWHTAIIPYLWRDMSYPYYSQKTSFCRMVLEDYLGKQRRQRWLNEGYIVRHDIPHTSFSPSALSKYGSWIRILPDSEDLLNNFHGEIARRAMTKPEGLVLHLFECCSPDVQVDFFEIAQAVNFEPNSPKKTIVDITLPRVRHLRVRITSLFDREVSRLMSLLDQCSIALRELELDVNIPVGAGMNDAKEESTMNEPKHWISLKKLGLYGWNDSTDTKTFWPWFFKRCGQIETLEMNSVRGTTQVLVQGMISHMPKLAEITLGSEDSRFGFMEDKDVPGLLSGSRNGWRVLNVRRSAKIGIMAMKALERHSSTLESLTIDTHSHVSVDALLQVLSSCINLHTLINVNASCDLDARMFADQDPVTGSLKPWKCEPALKVLMVTIVGITRPTERNRGSGSNRNWDMHNLVYSRLARLTKLETLCVRSNPATWHQIDCVRMSLESGLHILSGLEMLKELYTARMSTGIGVDEVQWMTEHWPRLRGIYGLYNERAVAWLWKNCPGIKVTRDTSW